MREYIFRYAQGFGGDFAERGATNPDDHYGVIAEQVTRCKDCRRCERRDYGFVCTENAMFHRLTDPQGFCHRALKVD